MFRNIRNLLNTSLLGLAVFAAGLCIGWFANSWLEVQQTTSTPPISLDADTAPAQSQNVPANHSQPVELGDEGTPDAISNTNNAERKLVQRAVPETPSNSNSTSISDIFNNLLNDRRYQEAIDLYQEQEQAKQNTNIAAQLRNDLVNKLGLLTRARRNSDFSTLIEHYLSVYYDDIDILLLLADFNQVNGSYLEVVNVYLLAKTYAYADVDQQKVLSRFNGFVEQIDRSYTNQRNWWSLINFYSHINTSGLLTSTHQYSQALAYLRSGDEAYAIEQFNQLLSDSVVGESAALALNNLDNNATAPEINNNPVQDHSESIDLQKVGNQYAVNLTNNRQNKVNLLIDTGASMTVISSAAFNQGGIGTDAVEQDRRVFRTAGGVVMGTVYSVPELQLGPYFLQDTQVAVLDFETARTIDGLLGMNILGQFRFQIDQENTQLHLSKK